MNTASFKILTFNVWMLDVLGQRFAKDISQRLRLIPEAVVGMDADVIAFQEVWMPLALSTLKAGLVRAGYSHFSHTRTRFPLGNGLLIASRLPLDPEVKEFRFTHQTHWAEKLVRKGAIYTRVWVRDLGWVDVFNTHVGSVGWDKKSNQLNPHHVEMRALQIKELQAWIRQERRSATMVLAGDLNLNDIDHKTGRVCETYQGLLHSHDFRDAGALGSHWQPTFCTKQNPYAKSGDFGVAPSERVDYVLVTSDKIDAQPIGATVFTGPVEGFFLSDHFGVLADISSGFETKLATG